MEKGKGSSGQERGKVSTNGEGRFGRNATSWRHSERRAIFSVLSARKGGRFLN